MEFTLTNALIALGQLLIGALFVYGGLSHFGPAAEKIIPLFEARGVPMPRQALYVASVFQLVCGAGLMLGVLIVPAALGLILFTIAASVVMANFWDMPPGEEREALQNVWASNIAIIGGLLLAAAAAL
ncbi:MAG: DoxX family protein [Hyphomicrobium sp.]|uniref:DoxX family protein n=1 Tax=Hyphomicrobium sp. TaxID=82 RepID=UPI0013277213|nr:DoxX family protein [Hyphomicrobium sp.]KAB2942270.1 MAG: DoxX family protein [Hyphomicrobium sp.]MBZ0208412.1 DoxX family protein [Hyphomicrobium sp.]